MGFGRYISRYHFLILDIWSLPVRCIRRRLKSAYIVARGTRKTTPTRKASSTLWSRNAAIRDKLEHKSLPTQMSRKGMDQDLNSILKLFMMSHLRFRFTPNCPWLTDWLSQSLCRSSVVRRSFHRLGLNTFFSVTTQRVTVKGISTHRTTRTAAFTLDTLRTRRTLNTKGRKDVLSWAPT